MCKIFSGLVHELRLHSSLSEFLWEWFISVQGGLDILLYSAHRHKQHCVDDSRLMVMSVIHQFTHVRFTAFFGEQLKARFSDPLIYLEFVHSFVNFICKKQGCKEELVAQSAVPFLTEYTLSCCRNTNELTVRVSALSFLKTLWELFPQMPEVEIAKIVGQFSNACAEQTSLNFRSTVHTYLLILLHRFLDEHDKSNSAIITKILVKSLSLSETASTVEIGITCAEQNAVLQEHVLTSVTHLMELHTDFPVTRLALFVIKQVSQIGYGNTDISFFMQLAIHPRLDVKTAILVLQTLDRICINDALYARAASIPALILLFRFAENKHAREYLNNLVRDAIQKAFLKGISDEPSTNESVLSENKQKRTTRRTQKKDNLPPPPPIPIPPLALLPSQQHIPVFPEVEPTLAMELLAKIIFLRKSGFNTSLREHLSTGVHAFRVHHGYDDETLVQILNLLDAVNGAENDNLLLHEIPLERELMCPFVKQFINKLNDMRSQQHQQQPYVIDEWVNGLEVPLSPSLLNSGSPDAQTTGLGGDSVDSTHQQLFSPSSKARRKIESIQGKLNLPRVKAMHSENNGSAQLLKKPNTHDGTIGQKNRDGENNSAATNDPLPSIHGHIRRTRSQMALDRKAEIEDVKRRREEKISQEKQRIQEQQEKEERIRNQFRRKIAKSLKQRQDKEVLKEGGSAETAKAVPSKPGQSKKKKPRSATSINDREPDAPIPAASESHKIAIELFDEILSSAIGIHILEPTKASQPTQTRRTKLPVARQNPHQRKRDGGGAEAPRIFVNEVSAPAAKRPPRAPTVPKSTVSHDENGAVTAKPQRPSPGRRPDNKLQREPSLSGFFTRFKPEQRAIALYFKQTLDQIVEDVVSGKAAIELNEKQRRRQHHQRLLRERRGSGMSVLNSVPQSNLLQDAASITENGEKISAVGLHHRKIEQARDAERQKRQEEEKLKLKQMKERKEQLAKQLEEYHERKKTQDEEIAKKTKEEQMEQQRKQREQQEAERKLRKQQKERVEAFRKQQQEEQHKREEEQRQKELKEQEEKKRNVEEYKERQKQKSKRIRAAVRIQRLFRKYRKKKIEEEESRRKAEKKALKREMKQRQQQQQQKVAADQLQQSETQQDQSQQQPQQPSIQTPAEQQSPEKRAHSPPDENLHNQAYSEEDKRMIGPDGQEEDWKVKRPTSHASSPDVQQ